MKNIVLITFLFMANLAQCQMTSNIISESEFDSIKINNVSLTTIRATEGREDLVENLYSNLIIEREINHGERGPSNYWFKYDGFEFAFTGSAGTREHPGLSSFYITDSNWSINIQGITIKIGDDISLLGNVVFNTRSNGIKSIIYQFCDGCNSFIYIYFNKLTNKIIEIGFVEII